MEQVNILELRKLCNVDNMVITKHCALKMVERNILLDDVMNTINSGVIIEYYPTDYPQPSCLILGLNIKNKHTHVVCSICDTMLWIITAYYPNTTKWEDDYKTRKRVI